MVAGIRELVEKPVVPGTTAHISGGLRLYPLERSPQGDAFFELVREAGETLGMRLSGQHYESAAESGFCAGALGIPTICCMRPEGENIHTAQEYMLPSTLLPRCKLMALSALQAARAFGHQPRPSMLPPGADA